MAGLYRAVVRFPRVSGVPADEVDNTFHFGWTGVGSPGSSDFDALREGLEDFYTDTAGGGVRGIAAYLSPVLSRTTDATVDIYNINTTTGQAGNPVAIRSLTLGAVSGSAGARLPEEVACCLSFRGSYSTRVEDEPAGPTGPEGDHHLRARVRGRVYIGPLVTLALHSASAGDEARVSQDLQTDLVESARDFLHADLGSSSWAWSVYSRVEQAYVAVTVVWVDNAWDTQRRRGAKTTSRLAVTL